MNMILHIFKKDIRRTRALLVVWIGVVALQCVLIGTSVRPGDHVLQGLYYTISVIAPLLQMLVLLVMIPVLVQEEPLVGTTAFWFTRPIPRPALLGSKALFAAMLVLLPLAAELCVLLANGFTPHDMRLAALEIVLTGIAFIAPIALIAVFTSSFGRFAIAGAIVYVAFTLVNLAIVLLRMLIRPEWAIAASQNLTLVRSTQVAAHLLAAFAGCAIIAHQYLSRRTGRSIGFAVVLAVASIAIGSFWPWNFFKVPPSSPTGGGIDAAAVKLSLGRVISQEISGIRGIGAPQRNFTGEIEVSGLPEGCVAVPKLANPKVTLADGKSLEVQQVEMGTMMMRPDLEAIDRTLGDSPVANRGFRPWRLTTLFRMSADAYGRYASQAVTLTGNVDLVVSKYVVAAEMPLVRGARYDNGSEHIVITDVLRQGEGIEIVLHRSRPQLLFGQADWSPAAAAAVLASIDHGKTAYVLRNLRRHESVIEQLDQGVDLSAIALIGSRRLLQQNVRLLFGPEQNVLTPDLSEDWLADAKLVRLELVPIAEFPMRLTAEKLRLDRQNQRMTPVPPPPAPSFANVSLPKNATKSEVREYVFSILSVSQRRTSFEPTDPEVELLAKVGPDNLDVLLAAEDRVPRGGASTYLDEAIRRLAQPKDKSLILQALAVHPQLIQVVVKQGWNADARDTVMASLKDEREVSLPGAWLQVAASFQDPATYPDLKAYLLRCRNKQQAYTAIRKLPGLDLRATVDAIWKEAKAGENRDFLGVCGIAAEYGHLDAVEATVNYLKQDFGSAMQQRHAATIIKKFTPATGDKAALIAWFEANKGRLAFDPDQRKFVPRPGR